MDLNPAETLKQHGSPLAATMYTGGIPENRESSKAVARRQARHK